MKSPSRLWLATASVALASCLISIVGCSRGDRAASHLANAERFYEKREFDMAKIEYINVLRIQPTNRTAQARLGRILVTQGQIYDAFPLLSAVRDANPDHVEAREDLITVFAVGSRYATNSQNILDRMRIEVDAILSKVPTNEVAILALGSLARTPEEVATLEERIGKLRQQFGDRAIYHIADGTRLSAQRNTNAAEAAFRAAVTLEPQLPVAHRALGEFLAATGRREAAEAELRTAAQLAPPHDLSRRSWARFLVSTGRIPEAKAVLDDILAKAPELTGVWVSRAELALFERDYDTAENLLRRVLGNVPQDPDALRTLGQLRLSQRKPTEAIEAFRGAIPRTGELKRPPLLYDLAIAYLATRDGANSAAALEAAVRIQPDLTPAVLMLAELNIARGRTEETIQSLRELIQRQPNLERAHLLLVRAYSTATRHAEATAAAQAALQQLPQSAAIAFQLGQTLRTQNNLAEAQRAFEVAGQLTTNTVPVVVQLAEIDLARNDAPAALQRVETELARQGNEAALWLLKGRVHRALKANEPAEAAFKRAIELNPDSAVVYENLAQLYLETGKQAEAAEQLEGFLKRKPDRVDQWILLAMLQQERKEYQRAREAYEKAIDLRPNSAFALNNLAYLLSELLKDPAKAYEVAQKARAADPNEPAIADTLGWLEFGQGRYQQAAQLLTESASRLTTNPEVQFHLGMSAYMMGQEDAARQALRFAVSAPAEFPGKNEARDRLAFLDQTNVSRADLEQRVQANPKDVIAVIRLGNDYAAQGDTTRARESYDAALKVNPDSPVALIQLAKLHARPLQQPAKALELANAARQRAPNDPEIAHALGRLAFDAGDQAHAYSLLQESARRLTDRPDIAADLAWAAYSQSRVEEAVQWMERAQASGPSAELALQTRVFLAMVAASRSPNVQAAADIQKVLESDPRHGPALMAYGQLAEAQGKIPEARDAYDRLLSRFPEFTPAIRQLAILTANHLNDDAKAYELCVRARQAYPRDEVLATAFGKVVSRRGEHRFAVQLLSDASRIRTNDASLFYQLGVSHQALNQTAESRTALTKAVALAPADAPFLADARQRLAAVAQSATTPSGRPN